MLRAIAGYPAWADLTFFAHIALEQSYIFVIHVIRLVFAKTAIFAFHLSLKIAGQLILLV